MDLSRRQRRALEEICDALCPASAEVSSARDLRVADAVLEAVRRNPRSSERAQLAGLLSLWDTAALGALGGGGFKRFSRMPQRAREQLLISWRDSRIPQRRAVFHALRKASLLFYYMLPRPDGTPNPAWDAIGYDGPLGPLDRAPPKPLTTLPIERDARLECDVVIVGSGAGGGAAAGVLSAAGCDVVVVESGGYFDDQDFEGSEFDALTGYYMAAPAAM
jgi:long-chain-alcohol oxidase